MEVASITTDTKNDISMLDVSQLALLVDSSENCDHGGLFTDLFTKEALFALTPIDNNLVEFDENIACSSVIQRESLLSSPMGGISFNADPILGDHDTIVVLGISYKVMFPTDFEWNQGGYLPGLHGLYNNTNSSTALAKNLFETRWKWDARGKFGISTRMCSGDPNEWITSTDARHIIKRGEWYILSVVAHIDGEVRATLNGAEVYRASCPSGLHCLTGTKISIYSLDNTGIENKGISVSALSIGAKMDKAP
mmetsp:Transcript_94027/g.184377  ORF Transcript_94027/g.184377 Transcript_94027/m.184377 type:complete len:252 (-) Transcript_94027:162-917(-)